MSHPGSGTPHKLTPLFFFLFGPLFAVLLALQLMGHGEGCFWCGRAPGDRHVPRPHVNVRTRVSLRPPASRTPLAAVTGAGAEHELLTNTEHPRSAGASCSVCGDAAGDGWETGPVLGALRAQTHTLQAV